MSVESLIQKLQSIDAIDAKIIAKLQKQIDNPEKNVTAKKILSFLVKNEFLTKEQAIQLKQELENEAQQSQHTDDLVAGVMEPSAADVVEPEDYAEAQLDEVQPVATGDDAPTLMFEPEHFDDPTVIVDPAAVTDETTGAPAADPLTADWNATVPDDTAGAQFTFEGKLDTSDQWATKWLYVGFGLLGLIVVAGTLLFFFLSFISAEDRFEAAKKSFEDGTYGDAIKKFDEYLAKHPSHEKVPIAKVVRVQALLADTFKQRNWDETIVRAENHLPKLVEDESVDLETIRQDLAVILPTSALEIAKRATRKTTKSELTTELKKAKSARQLVDNAVYIPNSRRKQAAIAKILDELDEEIAKGDGLIRKQEDFDTALTEIRKLREARETDQAFSIYNQLIRNYGDLRANQELQTEMRQVSQIESELVVAVDPGVVVQQSAEKSPISSTVVLASKIGRSIQSLEGEVLPVLAEGSVYGIDLGGGQIVWRKFVGYQTSIQPLVMQSGAILVSDQRRFELSLIDAGTGELVWRSELGEDFAAPQINEGKIFLTTRSGKLLKLSVDDGQLLAAVQIPQAAEVPMTRSKRNGLIYQPGSYSNLYVLSDDDLSCKNVYYIGHRPGSIAVEPVVWNGLVLIAVNQSGVCDLHVLRPDSETGELQLVQRIRRVTQGLVTRPLQKFGRFMLVTSRTGDLKILEVNTAEENNPIRILASENFENRENVPTYLTTAGSQMWIGAKGITRYKVSRSLGTFDRQQISDSDDYFIGPLHKFGDTLIHVRKRFGSALASIAAVDSKTLQQIWRTDVGGPLVAAPMVVGNQILAVTSQGNLFLVDGNTVSSNQIVADRVKASNIDESLFFEHAVAMSNTTMAVLGPSGSADMLFVDGSSADSSLMKLPSPADQPACRPIRLGQHLIVPTKQGQVLRIDPRNSRIVGTPFLPPVSPGKTVSWKIPAAVGPGQLVIGADSMLYLIDGRDEKVLKKISELKVDGVLKSPLAAVDSDCFGCLQKGGSQKLIRVSTGGTGLQLEGSIDLGAFVVGGPWIAADRLLLRLADDSLQCFDRQLERQWSVVIGSESLVSPPVVTGSSVQLSFGNGTILRLAAESGETVSKFELGQPISQRPVSYTGRELYGGLDGTIHSVEAVQ